MAGWSGLPAAYDVARAKVLIGRCLRDLGDEESATRELAAAQRTFRELGATPAARELDALLSPGNAFPDGLTAREVEVLRLVATGAATRRSPPTWCSARRRWPGT